MAYSVYKLCRTQAMFKMEKSTGKNKSKVVVVPWTTGLHSLPEQGGMLDQSFRMMLFFEQFIDGDRQAAMNRLNKAS